MLEAIPPLPKYVFMAWCLVKHRDFSVDIKLRVVPGTKHHAVVDR
jgi:hypothetical protein